jgi:hypothetical protein
MKFSFVRKFDVDEVQNNICVHLLRDCVYLAANRRNQLKSVVVDERELERVFADLASVKYNTCDINAMRMYTGKLLRVNPVENAQNV